MKNKKSLFGLLTVLFLLIAMAVPTSAATEWLDTRVCRVGQSLKITLGSELDSSKNGYLSWSSSNTSVATVSSKGVVYCKKKGMTTITASFEGDSLKFNLTVSDKYQPIYSYYSGWNDCWIHIQYVTPSKMAVTIHNKGNSKRSFKITKLRLGKHTYDINMKAVSLYGGHETHVVLNLNKEFKKKINLSDTLVENDSHMWRKSS